MSDLIRKQNAIDAALTFLVEYCGAAFDEDMQKMLCEKLDALPSAELERKKGKWIDEKINSYTSRTYCSECGSSAPFVYKSDDYYGNHAHGETAKTKFCPNCGADMRGENGKA